MAAAFGRFDSPPPPPSTDTKSLNALLGAGGDVRLEARTYHLTADDKGLCLVMKTPGTRLILGRQTVLQLAPSALGNYQILYVTSPDCSVTGGNIVGDVRSHLGDDGEWGHGIRVAGAAHRTRLDGVVVTECWGDGFYVGGGAKDVVLANCTAQNNRRQGLSVTSASRLQVIRGRYSGTGWPARTDPSAGIDVEPNKGERVQAVLRDVESFGNRGPGVVLSGSKGAVDVDVIGGSSSGNDGPGYLIAGAGARIVLRSATAAANTVGVEVERRVAGATIDQVTAEQNRAAGFAVAGPKTYLRASTARGNGAEGFVLAETAAGSRGRRLSADDNSRSRSSLPQVSIAAPDCDVRDVAIGPGATGRDTPGVVVRPSAQGTVVSDVTSEGVAVARLVDDQRQPADPS